MAKQTRKKLLRVHEVADLLGVHEDTVRDWSNKGKLAAVRTLGGHRRFSIEAVDAFVQQHAGLVTGTRVVVPDERPARAAAA